MYEDMDIMSKRERKAREEVIRVTISEKKGNLAEKFGLYREAAKTLVSYEKKLIAAEKALRKKATPRNTVRFDQYTAEMTVACKNFKQAEEGVYEAMEIVHEDYIALEDLTEPETSKAKVRAEYAKFSDMMAKRMADIEMYTSVVDIDSFLPPEEEVEEEPVEEVVEAEEVDEPVEEVADEPAAEVPAQPQAKIAPVSLDVTEIVEKAIAATLQRFIIAFDKRIDAFLADHEVNIPESAIRPAPSVVAVPLEVKPNEGGAVAVDATVVDGVNNEKINGMVDTLKALAESLDAAVAGVDSMTAKVAETGALQKQTNEMQRSTLREQKGIQVNQKVLSQDQLQVAQDQAMLVDAQFAILEQQNALTEAQQALAEAQQAVSENHAVLEDSMREVLLSQKDIIDAQQQIITANNKNITAQTEVNNRQAETVALQKEALANQKRILREQKALNEKQKVATEAAPKKARAAKKETPVAEVPAVEVPVAEATQND